MAIERRRTSRESLVVECSWGRNARITDLSVGGCYVDTLLGPTVGERIVLDCTLDDHMVQLTGRVVYVVRNLGFGLEFEALSEETSDRVSSFLRNRGHELDANVVSH